MPETTRAAVAAGLFFYTICHDAHRDSDLFVFEYQYDLFAAESVAELKDIKCLKHAGLMLDEFLLKQESIGQLSQLCVVDWQNVDAYANSDRVMTLTLGVEGSEASWGLSPPLGTQMLVKRWCLRDKDGIFRATVPYVGKLSV